MKRREKPNYLPLVRRVPPRRHSSSHKKASLKNGDNESSRGLLGRIMHLVHILFCLSVLAVLYKVISWSGSMSLEMAMQDQDFDTSDGIIDLGRKDIQSGDEQFSEIITHVGSSGTGLMNKYFYRFRNIQIVEGRIKFYYNENTFTPPSEEHWVDIVSCNATSPNHPTMLVIKGDAQPIRWHYIPIDYIPAGKESKDQLTCKNRVTQTAYLLQVRYSYNIWHTWNEGIMGLFQTLREIGRLPLALVGADGKLTELTDGMGIKPGECPWIYDHAQGRSVRMESCSMATWKRNRRCDLVKDSWCKPGAVFSMSRLLLEHSPLILTFTKESTKNVWTHLYDSISMRQKTLDSVMGSCFSDIIIGKTSTLNFYQTLNSTPPAPQVLAKVPRIDNVEARVEAMAVFKEFIVSSQREWVKKEAERTGYVWGGYEDKGLEKLRQGVGAELAGTDALNAITPKSVAGVVREEIDELKKSFERHESLVNPIVKEFEKRYGFNVPDTLSDQDAEKLFDEESKAALVYEDLKKRHVKLNLDDDREERTRDRVRKSRMLQSVESPSSWFVKSNTYRYESPLPVVTYMSRNFFARGVVNEKDILEYIVSKYDVTLRVTTFQEPLLEVMELLAHSDVLFGMHGAGWTNALFMKRGATTMQMYPYGWNLPDKTTVRGYNYREIVYASEGHYFEWVNPKRENAYFRRIDFKKDKDSIFQLHPGKEDPLPEDRWPGNQWVYQNTYVDMKIFGKEIDVMMKEAGIKPKS